MRGARRAADDRSRRADRRADPLPLGHAGGGRGDRAARGAAARRPASAPSGSTGTASPTSTPAGAATGRCSASTATPTWCRRASRRAGGTIRSAAVVEGGRIYGRGAADMKSGVAAFVAAAVDFVAADPAGGQRRRHRHRRRGGRRRRRHRGDPRLDGRERRADGPLHRRRADLPEPHGRDDQDRPARLADRAG